MCMFVYVVCMCVWIPARMHAMHLCVCAYIVCVCVYVCVSACYVMQAGTQTLLFVCACMCMHVSLCIILCVTVYVLRVMTSPVYLYPITITLLISLAYNMRC